MKFTKDTIRRLIAEEIENYLNEQGEDDPIAILRRLMKGPEAESYLDKLAKAREENPEEEFEPPTPLPPGEEREFPGSPAGIPGFQPDDDEGAQSRVAPTQEVPYLKRTPIGRRPRKSPATRIINKK
jgi:hypothetical protein